VLLEEEEEEDDEVLILLVSIVGVTLTYILAEVDFFMFFVAAVETGIKSVATI